MLLVIDGSWIVTVGQYTGKTKEGYHWKIVPSQDFFRLDVLQRQLAVAGLLVDVTVRGDRCVFRFKNAQGRAAANGARLKRFMSRNYGSFLNRTVSWKWEVRQYD